MVDINQENRVCMFYIINRLHGIINRLHGIITNTNNEVCKDTTEFYNELVYNLGVNTLRNHNNPKEENNG